MLVEDATNKQRVIGISQLIKDKAYVLKKEDQAIGWVVWSGADKSTRIQGIVCDKTDLVPRQILVSLGELIFDKLTDLQLVLVVREKGQLEQFVVGELKLAAVLASQLLHLWAEERDHAFIVVVVVRDGIGGWADVGL